MLGYEHRTVLKEVLLPYYFDVVTGVVCRSRFPWNA